MWSRRMQLIFLALVAALVIGQALMGSVRAPTLQEMWTRITG